MPFNSSIYTDLELPSLNQDASTYGTIINTYFQGLENKLKAISDRVNAAGVGDSSTLAQINSDIAEVNSNISGILPDPYSGNYTTLSSWPSYNTELTALGLSPPETASEIESFFGGSAITSFVGFLDGKLDAINAILDQVDLDIAASEVDVCKANIYSAAVTNPSAITYRTVSTGFIYVRIEQAGVVSPFSLDTIYQIDSSSNFANLTYTIDDVYNQYLIATAINPVIVNNVGLTGPTSGFFRLQNTSSWGNYYGDYWLPSSNTSNQPDGTIVADTGSNNAYISYAVIEVVPATPDVSGCG